MYTCDVVCDMVRYLFGIDSGVQSDVSDQVDDPLLCLLRGHIQFGSQHAMDEYNNMLGVKHI